jgi:hypothetical protein
MLADLFTICLVAAVTVLLFKYSEREDDDI